MKTVRKILLAAAGETKMPAGPIVNVAIELVAGGFAEDEYVWVY